MNRSDTGRPPVSVVIPTRSRPAYLEVALRSIAPQARAAGGEVIVVDDGDASDAVRELAERHGARYHTLDAGEGGLNAARNAGVRLSRGELVAFVDDDIEAHPGWLAALVDAARQRPDVDAFTGPVVPRLDDAAPRTCGRHGPPITYLDLGSADTDARYAWGANMTLRRSALERVGPFDVAIEHGGDESQWQDRLLAAGGRPPRYVARAAVDHRRVGADARLRALARTGWARGRAARRYDRSRGDAPAVRAEALLVARNLGHVARRACPAGLALTAQAAGRLREALLEQRGSAPASPDTPDFLSGASGAVGGLDGLKRAFADATLDAGEVLTGRRARLARAARGQPARRKVLALAVVRPENEALASAAARELRRSRHEVDLHVSAAAASGKFENVNALLAAHPADGHDWLLVIDDDVELPRGFTDRFLFLTERFDLQLAQPAHRLASHAAWEVTRRRPGSAVRETAFVEIGPVTAFAAPTFHRLLPFPPLRMGWGLDAHWAALARAQAWRCGIVDAVAIGHRSAPAAAAYSRAAAIDEAQAFLRDRPYLPATELQRTLATHRRW